ncbi:GAF domain-containing protein [Ignavibacterium album JCM 16511]|uniref:GAF domain-containing protein n=1 Tax=Ignavibacterium album (strain DSM 19864 / JCM 16511 / NBRC 101810 / Mat9-16) TaxID=945713 RepID=I0AIG8_IGNAJ|nr:GAF domain-containing protein [Ignavibacterium album]AFH48775.1 GAF domain-containing protein [Ignavibacterium album JCM 16511]
MAEVLEIKKDAQLSEQYELLIRQLKSLLSKEERLITNLSNLTAALKQTFDKISWVGFYLFDGEILYLGPFQGKVACTTIKLGTGVCGTAAEKGETIIVPDVNKFPGHIFCDPDSKSEIVVPMFKNKKLIGVLDVDSDSFNSFDETDKKYLEEIVKFLTEEIIN